jgi:putative ABC transport system permease protein
MNLLSLAFASLRNRRATALLTLSTIAISVFLQLGVERIRSESRKSFASTIAGTDLIVGARTGAVQLLLYSVFRIGDATNNIRYESYSSFQKHPAVRFAVPISLGDSHRGFRVVGTTEALFEHYRYGSKRALEFAHGQAFQGLFEVVLGADVARQLGYQVGQELVLSHGTGRVSLVQHDDHPFRVVGILKPTATPIDRGLYVSLEAIEAIHLGFRNGVRVPTRPLSGEQLKQVDLQPKQITAIYLGLKTPTAAFTLQGEINQYREEPLLAILPGATLSQLWSLVSVAEHALTILAALVVVAGLLGMLSTMLSGLALRRREMAVLRALGARPWHILLLLVFESALLTCIGIVLGVVLLYGAIFALAPWLAASFGIDLSLAAPGTEALKILAVVLLSGILLGLLPGLRALKTALADGLSVRL